MIGGRDRCRVHLKLESADDLGIVRCEWEGCRLDSGPAEVEPRKGGQREGAFGKRI